MPGPRKQPRSSAATRRVAILALLALSAGCAARSQSTQLRDAATGEKLFQSYCAACHQYDGQGVGEAPPLDRAPWVTGPRDRLVKIVLHGVRGAMDVHGVTFNREMPGFGRALSDTDIAALLSFVRKRFGDPSPPITPSSVSRVRAANPNRTEYWSVDELLAQP